MKWTALILIVCVLVVGCAAGISAEEAHNRALLCKFMLAAGFKPFQEEWWHYTLKNEPYPATYFDFAVQ